MKSYLLSWLRKTHAGSTRADFERERAGTWLVWEAGPWRPPSPRRDTLIAGPQTGMLASGESLAIVLEPKGPGAEVRLLLELMQLHLLFDVCDDVPGAIELLSATTGTPPKRALTPPRHLLGRIRVASGLERRAAS